VLCLATAAPWSSAFAEGDARLHFEATMASITADLAGLVVTSKHRTEADQARIAEAGYRPHPRSQHKLGLAWDCDGPAESLETLRARAQAAGFVALAMKSPVTGDAYVHVQRYVRSPALDLKAPRVLLAERPPLSLEPVVGVAELLRYQPAIELPRPLDVRGFELPRRLLRKRALGRIVLLLELSDTGEVLDVEIDSSDLPAFEEFVAGEVRRWRFSPTRIDGRPAAVHARLPIPIRVQ
jgi:hypothetical protein